MIRRATANGIAVAFYGMTSRQRFDQAPRRVYWEVTRACDLACHHCRAAAATAPDPAELTPDEGLGLGRGFDVYDDDLRTQEKDPGIEPGRERR